VKSVCKIGVHEIYDAVLISKVICLASFTLRVPCCDLLACAMFDFVNTVSSKLTSQCHECGLSPSSAAM
jgi:hypothetical protein